MYCIKQRTPLGTTTTLKPGNRRKQERKYKSSWFTNECEAARREFKQANRTYTRNKTDVDVDILLTKRRLYRIAKRRTRYKFNLDQKRKLNNLAKSKPQQFWTEIEQKIQNRVLYQGRYFTNSVSICFQTIMLLLMVLLKLK